MSKETIRQTIDQIKTTDSMKAVKVAFDLSESNQDSITKNIDKLLSNKKLRNELGKNGRDRARSEYSWTSKVDEYLDI